MSKPIRRHNRGYSGGFPISTGDRDYSQDIFRDQAYQESLTGIAYDDLTQQAAPYVLAGLVAKQGAGHTMDISAGKAVVPFTVTIPDTVAAWTVPPSTTTANIDMVLDYAGGTSLSLAGTVTDGATPNYVKLAYTETNGNTRNRVKKSGSYAYEVYDTVTVTINDTAPTATEINILTFTTDGATVTVTDNGDTRIGSPFHMQDAVVYDQTTYNDCIVRVAANQYKIRDDIKSLYAANLSGGYLMTGGTSPLSGGDTWGYIETNNCKQIIFEKGAAIHMGNERGYLEVNTDDCYLKNVSIIGTGTVASAILRSFYINSVDNVILENCNTSVRLSNLVFSGVVSTGTSGTEKLINCTVESLECTAAAPCSGFNAVTNLVNCQVLNMSTTAGGQVSGFQSCKNLTNCYVYDLDSTIADVDGFYLCDNLTNCKSEKLDHSGSVAGKNAYGFNTCTQLSNCKAEDVDTNGAGGEAHGFKDCDNGLACYATTCNNGFDGCTYINSSVSESNSLVGFQSCFYLGACSALTNTGDGFDNSDDITNCSSDGNGGDGFDSGERIVASVAVNNTGWGFRDSKQLSICRSTGNTTGQYTNCFADFGAANAVADTAAGGYNG